MFQTSKINRSPPEGLLKTIIDLVSHFDEIPDNLKHNNKIRIGEQYYASRVSRVHLTKYGYEIQVRKKYSEGEGEFYIIEPEQFYDKLHYIRKSKEYKKTDFITPIKELGLIIKNDINLSDLQNIKNQERRSAFIKKLGWDNIRQHVRIIDEFDDYVLFDFEGRFLKMRDSSTDREYILRVPDRIDCGLFNLEIRTCVEALAWSFNMQPHEYRPELET